MAMWLRLLALVASGAGQALLLPPIGAWWLSPVILVPALWALRDLRGWRALGAGWLVGISAVVALGYWIAPTVARFGHLPVGIGVLALLLYAVVFGAYAGGFAWALSPLRRITGTWWPLGAAALWVSCEFLNPQMFAHFLGLAFYGRPAIFVVTAVTGIAGVSFQIVLASAVITAALESRALPRGPGAVALALLILTIGYGNHRSAGIEAAQAAGTHRRIALVQDNLGVPMRRALANQGPTEIADALVAQSRRALEADPTIEVLVWPESALPGTPLGPNGQAVRDLVKSRGIELWTGGHAWQGERIFNAAFRVHGAGIVDPPYRKNLLVPFGEYLPGSDAFPSLQKLWRRGRNHPGDEQPVFDSPAGSFSFLICYEAIKSSYVRRVASQPIAIDLLVNLTDDEWFGATSCPHLHLAAAALQSAQLGLPMVRAASTGISAFIDARGVVTAQSALFAPTVLVADVPRVVAKSLYAAWGDWFAWACVAACVALLARAGWARVQGDVAGRG